MADKFTIKQLKLMRHVYTYAYILVQEIQFGCVRLASETISNGTYNTAQI